MILRFTGGPMDGLEEESTGTPPFSLFRMPSVETMMRAVMTGDPEADVPDFGAMYELVGLPSDGVARYRLAG